MTPDRPELPADIALLLEHLRGEPRRLAQAQVMPGAQGPGEQGR